MKKNMTVEEKKLLVQYASTIFKEIFQIGSACAREEKNIPNDDDFKKEKQNIVRGITIGAINSLKLGIMALDHDYGLMEILEEKGQEKEKDIIKECVKLYEFFEELDLNPLQTVKIKK